MVLTACCWLAKWSQQTSHPSMERTDIEAISAIDRTQQNMPTQTARKVHIAPAGPPFGNDNNPVLVHGQHRFCNAHALRNGSYTSANGHVKPTITAYPIRVTTEYTRYRVSKVSLPSWCRLQLTFSSCGLRMRCMSKSSAGVPGTWAVTTFRPTTVSTILTVAMRSETDGQQGQL